ncbi:MAG: DUF5667 domain-containing protein [bacterium]|nr:DUF5667 domain-containing protein [bacterium]
MSKLNFEKFVEDSKKIKLEKSEKDRILHFLKAEMMNESVREKVSPGHILWSTKLYQFKFNFTKPMPIAIIIALLITGGTSFAAQQSLPGDVLYPVKLEVNENVRGWLALSDEAKASLEARLAEERLKEAEKLAVKSELNAEVRAKIEQNFEKHAGRVEARIDKFGSSNAQKALEVNSNFQTSLDAHVKILNNIGVSLDGEVEKELDKLILKVRSEKESRNKTREGHEASVKAEISPFAMQAAEGKAKAVNNKIQEVKKFLNGLKERFGADVVVGAEARLKLAEETLAEGQAELEAGVYGEAFVLFQKAQNIAQEVKLLLNAKVEFEEEPENSPTPSSSVSPSSSPSVSPTAEPSTVNGSVEIDSETEVQQDDNTELRSKSRIRINLGF